MYLNKLTYMPGCYFFYTPTLMVFSAVDSEVNTHSFFVFYLIFNRLRI